MGLFSFTQEIAMDLGTANTIITTNGKIVVDEPSVVALDRRTDKMIAVGEKAKMMHDYFAYSEEFFKTFLSDPKNMENLKSEFFIPLMVDKLINDGVATCEVLDTTSKWFGVTYPEDRQSVVDKIQALVDAGEYPAKLF